MKSSDAKDTMEVSAKKPALSIIVPVYNEAGAIDGLFHTLGSQSGVIFELIICDGGSSDTTVPRTWSLVEDATFPVSVVHCERGRGRQLNAGAAASRGETLLFLHADSRFTDPGALSTGLSFLQERIEENGSDRVAGRFALNFIRQNPSPCYGYYYYESKARLSRRHCIHGDQGFLLRRSFFLQAGPFPEALPFLEDTILAETIAHKDEWLLLPATIHTSARRFETEGLSARQTLNAIILNFSAIGREDFLFDIPHIYSNQSSTARLRLAPFFRAFHQRISALPWREKRQLWFSTGVYVRDNAWQLALALDIHRNFRRGLPADQGTHPFLHFYDRYLDRLTNHLPGRLLATLLVSLWFQLSCLLLSLDCLLKKPAASPSLPRE